MSHFLVTGGAGFIGSHLVDLLMDEGHEVTVLDNLDPFYPAVVKRSNIHQHLGKSSFCFLELDICDKDGLKEQLGKQAERKSFAAIIHLAAKAGVRPSVEDPVGYHEVNARGTQNLLEFARSFGIEQFVFASSSSVYGVNSDLPWNEEIGVSRPISPYASSKMGGELIGHVYSHLYGIRFIALRFFNAVGPRQRPDLAIHKFAKKILAGEPIPVFGDGSTGRDYTYVGDIIKGIKAAAEYKRSSYEIINLGNNHPIVLNELIEKLEKVLGRKAEIDRLPPQPGDLPLTWANIEKAQNLLGYRPSVSLEEGLAKFSEWLQRES
jgi:UDP-glucuronate 4-epimerase